MKFSSKIGFRFYHKFCINFIFIVFELMFDILNNQQRYIVHYVTNNIFFFFPTFTSQNIIPFYSIVQPHLLH